MTGWSGRSGGSSPDAAEIMRPAVRPIWLLRYIVPEDAAKWRRRGWRVKPLDCYRGQRYMLAVKRAKRRGRK